MGFFVAQDCDCEIFGVGWGLSGICPGAAYASLGIGNVTILWAVVGMFAGAYLQGGGAASARRPTPPPRVPTNAARISRPNPQLSVH